MRLKGAMPEKEMLVIRNKRFLCPWCLVLGPWLLVLLHDTRSPVRRPWHLVLSSKALAHGVLGPKSSVRVPGSMQLGLWHLVLGPWSSVSGAWSVIRGPWPLVRGPWSVFHGHRSLVLNHWYSVPGPRSSARGAWSLVLGCWFCSMILGPCARFIVRKSRWPWYHEWPSCRDYEVFGGTASIVPFPTGERP